MIPTGGKRPRRFVKWWVNPFFHHFGKNAHICSTVRQDLFPFNRFALGSGSTVEDFATLNNGVGDLLIGDRSRIGIGNVLIGPIKIGNDCILAQNIVISALNHGYEAIDLPIKDQPVTTRQIELEDECWIGANVSITAGVSIGKHSVVGAGSVVTKSVPPYHIAVGNPARLVKKYDFEKKEWVKI